MLTNHSRGATESRAPIRLLYSLIKKANKIGGKWTKLNSSQLIRKKL